MVRAPLMMICRSTIPQTQSDYVALHCRNILGNVRNVTPIDPENWTPVPRIIEDVRSA
jgi:hypothetical protein